MKYILTLLLLTVAGSAFAQTGVFYDRTVRGEGITIYEHPNYATGEPQRSFWFYTYGEKQCELDYYTVDHRIQREVVAEAIAECPNSKFWPYNPLCDPVVVKVIEILDEIVTLPAIDADCDLNGQRWFMGTNLIDENGDSIGLLGATEGINFPQCIPSLEPFEDDVDICAKVTPVGEYVLRPAEQGGYYLWVQSLDDNHTDPLFDHSYEFTRALIEYPESELQD